MASISESVGQGGKNNPKDVEAIQSLLKRAGIDPGPVDGICGLKTINAVISFQNRFLTRPDGRVDPGGRTLRELNRANPITVAAPLPPSQPLPSTPVPLIDWSGDSAQWSQSKKLDSLAPTFRSKVDMVIAGLAQRKFQPHIVYGWRSVAVQQTLVDQGRSKVRFSMHNAQTPAGRANAWAADIIDKRWAWNEPDCHVFFKALGEEAKKQGLVWGGDWASFRDWAHIQGRQNSELALIKKESGL